MRRIRGYVLLLLLLLLLFPTTAQARGESARPTDFQDFAEVSLDDLLDQVVVTAVRRKSSLRNSPVTMHVITQEEINDSPAQNLSDLLRRIPGFQTKTWLSQFTNTSFRGMLGASVINERILWMVDGVPVNDVRDGGLWTDITIPLHTIKRIEVYTGPGSALYGTSAFQGIVHILTKDPSDLLTHGHTGQARVSYGSMNTTVNSLAVAGTTGSTEWIWMADAGSTEGPGLVRDRNRPGEPKHSGRQWGLIRGKYQRGNHQVQIGGRHTDQQYDGADFTFYRLYNWGRSEQWIDWKYNRQPHPKVQDAVIVSWHRYTEQFRDFADIPDLSYDIDSHRWFANIQRDQKLSDRHQLSFGAGMRSEHYRGNDFYPEHRHLAHANLHLFVQDELQLNPTLSLFTGARYDTHPRYQNMVSPQVSLMQRFAHGLGRARLTYGSAFKEPANWQAYIDQPSGQGNPNMRPEKLRSLELALDYQARPDLHLGVTGFRLRHENIIWEDFDPSLLDPAYLKYGITGKFHPRQPGDSANIEGLETAINYLPHGKTKLFLQGTWLRSRDADGHAQQYDAHRRLGMRIAHVFSDRWRCNFECYEVSDSIDTTLAYDPAVGVRDVPGYCVTGVSVLCRLSPEETLNISGWNIGRGIYEEMLGAPVPGTVWRLEFRRRF